MLGSFGGIGAVQTRGWRVARHRAWVSVAIFAACGAIGPGVALATWPPSVQDATLEGVSDLVFLVWPTQILGSCDSRSLIPDALPAIGLNILMFSILGAVTAAVMRSPALYFALAFFVFGGLLLWALWAAGLDPRYMNWRAFVGACAVYVLPFALAKWLAT